jgi:four helix bundle protein
MAFKKAIDRSIRGFEVSKSFGVEERYSLSGLVRRSSRSVCTNLLEAWAKRRYLAHFVSKLADADGENGETDTWLDFALASGYLEIQIHRESR